MTYRSNADLGGDEGRGRVVPETEDERFHAAWEKRAFALTLAMGATGAWNIDMSRSARETLPAYASSTYYEVWFEALMDLLAERGLVSADEIAAARVLHAPRTVQRVLKAADVAAVLARGSPTVRVASRPARFAAGERVRMRKGEVAHHTRLPGYARGKLGRIERVNGMHVYADAHAQGLGEEPQWLYTVAFDARELWGEPGADGPRVSIDAWEPYLERVA